MVLEENYLLLDLKLFKRKLISQVIKVKDTGRISNISRIIMTKVVLPPAKKKGTGRASSISHVSHGGAVI